MTFNQPFADYEILARVGSGAMGTVFKARQKKLDRIVALKVLKPALARDRHYVERLQREARIVAALNHPNIVTGYDIGQEGGYHYFVMEFIDGRSLKDLLREWGSFPEEQVLDVAVQVAHALDHAWQKGVIHRDIKPGNILIDQRGRVKLTDMGLAKGPEDLTLTKEGATVGTPQYISPEQARDPQTVDIRSDLYSLGATLFHMATGSPPFQAETTGQLIGKLLYERAPSAAAVNPGVSEGMSLVIRKLLAKDPGLRYQTPEELLGDLGRVQRQEAPAVNLDALLRAERGVVPRRTGVAVTLGALAVLIGGGVWYLLAREPGAEPVDARVQLGKDLDEKLREAKGRLAGWRVLERAEVAQSDPSLALHVRTLREGLEAAWRGEIDALLAEQALQIRAFLAKPQHWRDASPFAQQVVEPALRARFEAGPAELPAAVRRHYEGRMQQLKFELDRAADERDAEYFERLKKHLESDLAAVLQEHLGGGASADFRQAESAIKAAIDGWHGSEGRPQRHELPDQLRRRCEESEAQALAATKKRIDDDELAAGRELASEVEESTKSLRLRLDTDDPQLVEKALVRLEKELGEHHPPSSAFRGGNDPWPAATRKLRELMREISAAKGQAEHLRVDADLVAAYAALVATGDPSRELTWLQHLDVSDPQERQRLANHRALLQDAAATLRTLLDGLLVGKPSVSVPSPRLPGGLRVEKSATGYAVARGLPPKSGSEAARVGMCDLPWNEWLDGIAAETLRRLQAAERTSFVRGLALWLFCSGAGPRGIELLDPADRPFFANDIAHTIQAALALLAREDRPDAVDAWRVLKSLYAEGNLEKVKVALADFEARHAGSAVAASFQQGLKEIRAWVAQQARQEQLRRELVAALPASTDIELSDDRSLRISCPAAGLAQARGSDGFRREGDVAIAKVANPGESGLVWRRLPLPLDFPGVEIQALAARLRFPRGDESPRIAAVGFGGVALVVQVLRNGAVMAAIVPATALARSDTLQRAIQRPLEEAMLAPKAYVVEQARHDLVLRLKAGPRGTVVARAELDGILLREESVQKAAGGPGELAELKLSGGIALLTCEYQGRW